MRAVYGLKSSGAVILNQFGYPMHHSGFLSCPADLDLWIEPMVIPDDRFNCYAYVIIYVDYVIVIHHDADSLLSRIYKYFNLNPSFIDDPEIYLGDKLKKMRLDNWVWAWADIP